MKHAAGPDLGALMEGPSKFPILFWGFLIRIPLYSFGGSLL